jgi:hypothetical protein
MNTSTRFAAVLFWAGFLAAVAGWYLPNPWSNFTVVTGLFLIITIPAVAWRNTVTDRNEQ